MQSYGKNALSLIERAFASKWFQYSSVVVCLSFLMCLVLRMHIVGTVRQNELETGRAVS